VIVVTSFGFVALGYRPQVRVFLVGDSTMADKPIIDNPERGWGQMFPFFFDLDVIVENRAVNGRSTKSFIDEGRWRLVVEKLTPGDFVFIQFGHNDEKIADPTRYAAPHSDYKQNLIRFVRDARTKGAIPVLLTPVQRREFDRTGKLVDTHGDYPGVVREVAKSEQVSIIDLTNKSTELFNRLGPEKTKTIFMWVHAGIFALVPNGKKDNTHFTEYEAMKIAGLVSEGVRESNLTLKEYLHPVDTDSLVGLDKIVTLDYYYNSEWKQDGGKKVQFHYVWEDTTNSGFSCLGTAIDHLGANRVELQQAPTRDVLSKCSIYIIVDPDTPAETEHPSYIEDSSAQTIAGWVRDGGVLVLMGNDKGNAEFEHLNGLARRFGIHFNEDSYHRVVGNDFDKGKFASLPIHPIFTGVGQIYLKEICSLTTEQPAEPVLTEDGHIFMASSHYGKGLVFAVGDPWLYNEYVNSKKLPPEYDNLKAGENLFRWLLRQSLPTIN
jgi:lysophospholipase L1-like esterase